jgi:membrane protein required for beta-lactamase induction
MTVTDSKKLQNCSAFPVQHFLQDTLLLLLLLLLHQVLQSLHHGYGLLPLSLLLLLLKCPLQHGNDVWI